MDDRHARHRRADADRRRRPVDGFRTSSSRRFVRLVDDAVAALPKSLLALLDSIAIVVEDVPPAPSPSDGRGLTSAYEIAARDAPPSSAVDGLAAADRIVLYRRPLEARAASADDLTALVQAAVVTDLADHLGLTDDDLDELGWD
jgi:predicted Zn-dependent protease with MMP-like domain